MHTTLNIKTIAAIVLLMGVTCLIANDKVNEIYEKMSSRYASAETIKAGFVQMNHWQEEEIMLISEGQFLMDKERFALIYSRPEGQKIIVDKNVYIIEEKERRMIIAEADEQLSPIDKMHFYWGKSDVRLIEENDDAYILKIEPSSDEDTKSIIVTIEKENHFVRKIVYEDFSQNKVDFMFGDKVVNAKLDQSQFEIPNRDDYTVIDQTKEN